MTHGNFSVAQFSDWLWQIRYSGGEITLYWSGVSGFGYDHWSSGAAWVGSREEAVMKLAEIIGRLA